MEPGRLSIERILHKREEDAISTVFPEFGLDAPRPRGLPSHRPLGPVIDPKPQKLSLVIPAYNEEQRISQTIHAYASSLQGLRHEILVELDGCNDRTADLVRDTQQEFPAVELVEFPTRLGKGRGVIEGMRRATGDWIAYVDADGSVSPSEFFVVAKAALSDGADAVIASRYWDRRHMVNEIGLLRWTASRSFNWLVRHMYGLPFRDTQCGAKMLRRRAVRAIIDEMRVDGYAFDVELLWRLQQHGFKVVELPILWTHKDGSKVRIGHVASRMFLDVMRLRVNP